MKWNPAGKDNYGRVYRARRITNRICVRAQGEGGKKRHIISSGGGGGGGELTNRDLSFRLDFFWQQLKKNS